MKCLNHPDVEAPDVCSICGKPVCAACAADFRGKVTCYDCIKEGRTVEAAKPAADYGPLIALILSFIGGLYGFPGLGQIFNGQVIKGVILTGAVILTWLVLVAIVLLTWGFGIFVCFPLAFVPMLIHLYAIVDAYLTGKKKQAGLHVKDWL